MRTYHNSYRLFNHLRYSKPCFEALRRRGVISAPLPGRGSRQWRTVEQFSLCPWLDSAGPSPMPTEDRLANYALAPNEEALLTDLMNLELHDLGYYDRPDLEEFLWTLIRDCLCQHAADFQEMSQTLEIWKSLILLPFKPAARLVPFHVKLWCRAIDLATSRLSLAWLCPDLIPKETSVPNCFDGEQMLQNIPKMNVAFVPSPGYGPRNIQPIFLHFFSGRRREDDLQAAIEAQDWSHCWTPIVLSVDIVLDKDTGDIMNPAARCYWLRLIRDGHVAGLLAGPPCESWSVARERWRDTHTGPMPVRTSHELWGMASLLLAEARQVLFGNTLLQFSILAWFIQWTMGHFAVLEHPAIPDREGAPSIWYLIALVLMAELPDAQRALFHQGLFGAASPKPTFLLCAHAPPSLTSWGRSFQSRTTCPPALAMGRNAEGAYATAGLKEYPGPFNQMIAGAFRHWSIRATDIMPQQIPREDLDVLHRFVSHLGQGTMGPDYAFN